MADEARSGSTPMYHAIVRGRIRALFDAVNKGNAEPVLAAFAQRFEHAFLGEHALGGARHTLSATRRWYERLYRLLPDIHFDLRQIEVSGPPWNTTVVVDWDETNSGTDACVPPIAAFMSRICAGAG